MSKEKINELRRSQQKLCDEFITDIEKMDIIMSQYTKWNEKLVDNGFHHYSLRNLILANGQLFSRKNQCIELLAPYRRWQKVDRQVRKGEKALWILAPIQKKIKEAENPDEDDKYVTWFKRVPVFDLSQTDGEKLFDDWVSGESTISWQQLMERSRKEIILTSKTYENGATDGEKIWISENYGDDRKICVYLHELAHTKLHFGEDRKELDTPTKELEAETVSYMTAKAIGLNNEQSASYIKNWYAENPIEEIKNKGTKLINCAVEILSELGVA